MDERRRQENPHTSPLINGGTCEGYILCGRRWMPVGVSGFTLVELILATAISALVIGIMAVCFSFTLRVWEVTQNQKPDQTFQLADLIKRQLAESDPTPIKFSDTQTHPLFSAQPNSIAFVTSHSVRAISQGVPVVAHYTYDADSKMLSYSELPLDPYHPASIEKFLSGKNSGKQAAIHYYGVSFPQFELVYAGAQEKQFSQSWDSSNGLPVEVLMVWRGNDSTVHSQLCMVNSPIPTDVQQQKAPAPSGVSGLTPGNN